MIYQVRINKKLRNIRVYVILRSLSRKETFMTKLFIRLFNQQKKGSGSQGQQSATERLR